MAQKDRHKIFEKAPWVDVVFGTHNLGSLPALLRRSRHNKTAEIEIKDFLETFPSSLPVRRESIIQHGCPSRLDATTRALFVLFQACAAKSATGARVTS